jgi:hypothetical protein
LTKIVKGVIGRDELAPPRPSPKGRENRRSNEKV